jgi:DNA polymerase sigma
VSEIPMLLPMERHKVRAETLERMRATLLHQLSDAIALYRFGSWGTVYQRTDSDIDLAVLPSARLVPLQR